VDLSRAIVIGDAGCFGGGGSVVVVNVVVVVV
jgi:hypothetical protein